MISDEQLMEYATKLVQLVVEGDGDLSGVADVMTTVNQVARANELRPSLDADAAARLRAPFPPEAIGKLPRITCSACSRDKARKHCDNHARSKCNVCDNYITSSHIHLDYVGHAWVTHRLLEVDPSWNWEPVKDPAALGLPVKPGCMWIGLTVCGVTRYGMGDASDKDRPGDTVKEIIGDAIRNAAMRFGVALDLWMKELHGSANYAADERVSRHADQTSPRTPAQSARRQREQRVPDEGKPPADVVIGNWPRTLAGVRGQIAQRLDAIADQANKVVAKQAFMRAFKVAPIDVTAEDIERAKAFVDAVVQCKLATQIAETAAKLTPADEPATSSPVNDDRDPYDEALATCASLAIADLTNEQLEAELLEAKMAPPESRQEAEALLLSCVVLQAEGQFPRDEWPAGVTQDDFNDWFNGAAIE